MPSLPGRAGPVSAVTRAQDDLAAGNRATARQRLTCYLVDRPGDMAARRLLAQVYRADGHLDEAGRWGYLDPEASTQEERAAFEHGCAHRLGPERAATSIRAALRWPAGTPAPSARAARVLAALDKRVAAESRAWQAKVDPAPGLVAARAARHRRAAAREKERRARRRAR